MAPDNTVTRHRVFATLDDLEDSVSWLLSDITGTARVPVSFTNPALSDLLSDVAEAMHATGGITTSKLPAIDTDTRIENADVILIDTVIDTQTGWAAVWLHGCHDGRETESVVVTNKAVADAARLLMRDCFTLKPTDYVADYGGGFVRAEPGPLWGDMFVPGSDMSLDTAIADTPAITLSLTTDMDVIDRCVHTGDLLHASRIVGSKTRELLASGSTMDDAVSTVTTAHTSAPEWVLRA